MRKIIILLIGIFTFCFSPNFRQPRLIRKFKRTGYCNCKICCGRWADGKTAYNYMPKADRTIAVDPQILEPRKWYMVQYCDTIKLRRAEDTGRLIKGYIIDEYFEKHSEARLIRDSVNVYEI